MLRWQVCSHLSVDIEPSESARCSLIKYHFVYSFQFNLEENKKRKLPFPLYMAFRIGVWIGFIHYFFFKFLPLSLRVTVCGSSLRHTRTHCETRNNYFFPLTNGLIIIISFHLRDIRICSLHSLVEQLERIKLQTALILNSSVADVTDCRVCNMCNSRESGQGAHVSS